MMTSSASSAAYQTLVDVASFALVFALPLALVILHVWVERREDRRRDEH